MFHIRTLLFLEQSTTDQAFPGVSAVSPLRGSRILHSLSTLDNYQPVQLSTPVSKMRLEDLLIAIAYFSIPVQMVVSISFYPRLTSMPPRLLGLLILFALFIFSCGMGHVMRCMGITDGTVFALSLIHI